MILCSAHKAAYFHIAKTGGTSITYAMAPYLGRGAVGDPATEAAWHPRFHVGRMHDFLKETLPYTGAHWTVFYSVRNPYSRLLSHYLALQPSKNAEKNARPWNQVADERPMHEWLDWTFAEKPVMEGLYQPMYDLTRAGGVERDIRVLAFERLREDFEALCEEKGWPFVLPEDKKNPTRFPEVDAREFYEENPEAKDAVLRHYHNDFAVFGYSADPADIGKPPKK